ncbi:MAG: GNAT family N-acetyltransferase [Paracoccaceae bacterium]
MTKADTAPDFSVKLVETEGELRAAQALRYQVFVQELGGGGDLVDHANGLERDRFDPFFDHMTVTETASGQVVGVYRLMRSDQAKAAGQFYSEDEYDLTLLRKSGRRLLELGRSCLHRDYRSGMAMYHLWNGLADYVARHQIDLLFGVASFHGTDINKLSAPLSLLHHKHLAPSDLRVRARPAQFLSMDVIPPKYLDKRKAMIMMPALIKAYLRLGGTVGEGAWIDRDFNTVDICMVLDTERLNARQKRLYAGGLR